MIDLDELRVVAQHLREDFCYDSAGTCDDAADELEKLREAALVIVETAEAAVRGH